MIPSPFKRRTGTNSLVIRPARRADFPAIAKLAAESDMGELSDRGKWYVAAEKNHVVGFIRLVQEKGASPVWHVNPVVVATNRRREGIGAALMAFACERYGELRFVARGYAVPFYEALGCQQVSWDAITPLVASDCDDCDMIATCHPQPMRMMP